MGHSKSLPKGTPKFPQQAEKPPAQPQGREQRLSSLPALPRAEVKLTFCPATDATGATEETVNAVKDLV